MMQITFEGVHGNDEVYMDCLRSICGDTEGKSMVDLCCNLAPHTPNLGFKNRTYIDILARTLIHKDEQQYFVQANVIEYLHAKVKTNIDVGICSDGVEHMTEKDGTFFLKLMQLHYNKIVLFTPLGEYLVDHSNYEPEGHHSGWTPEVLEQISPNNFAYIVLPQYHPTLNIGAFFFWHQYDIAQDFKRVIQELRLKKWANNLQVHS